MNFLIRQARIISPGTAFDQKTADILVESGQIVSIRKSINARQGAKVIEGRNLFVSPGWVDMQAIACDPGEEHREDLDSLVRAAAAGGFTAVCVHSACQPALHSKSQIEYIVGKTGGKTVEVLPFGTITVDAAGKDLAEMYDMKQAGAVAFSDYKHPVPDAGMVLRALQYSANVGAFISTHCHERSVAAGGQMHEGEVSTALGLKGIPSLSEELMLERNLSVLAYAGGRLHIPTVSTRGSVDLVRRAKAAGLPVTCGVAAANLLLEDAALADFDTNFKLDPPLRTKKDIAALRNGIDNGTIDVIVSDHQPQDPESKELEFDHANPGMINIQTAFSCALESLGEERLPAIVRALAIRPREILGLEAAAIEEGSAANLTVFNTEASVLTRRSNASKSRNTPFFDRPMQGRVIGIIRGARAHINPDPAR